jgi:molybdopterin converting factor small subunit
MAMIEDAADLGPGEVEVRLAGALADLAVGSATARMPSGQTILEAAIRLGLPAHQRCLATVNGQVCAMDYVLAPGDRAVLFPPIAGGGQ